MRKPGQINDHRRRRRPVDHGHGDAVADHDLGQPPGRLCGQEAAVVADHDAAVSDTLLQHALGQALTQQADVLLGEAVGDDGAPPARSEFDHDVRLVRGAAGARGLGRVGGRSLTAILLCEPPINVDNSS